MKKPELKDFGLTVELLDLNKKQQEKYYKKLEEYCESVKKIKIAIIVISLIITFIVFFVNCVNGFESEDAGITLGIFAFWDVTVAFYCLQSLDASTLDVREGTKDEIKAQTMNLSLDVAVEKYNKAVSEYEYYLKKCSIDFWNSLDGFEFEKEIAKLFRKQGYDATVTSATGDGGVDIILRKNGERIAVQCKHHAKPVGPNDVRALQGVVAAQNYSKGFFISLNGYTSSVYYEVRSGRVKIGLLELNDILQMAKEDDINLVEPPNKPKPPKMNPPKDEPIIPLPNIDSEKQWKKQLIKRLIIKLYQSWGDKNIELILGKTVNHKEFGNGTIISTKDHRDKGSKYIDVYFADIDKKKTFVFPSAFVDKHISIVDFKNIRKD